MNSSKRQRIVCGISGGSKFLEIKIVAVDAGVFNNVGNDAARHVTRMPRKGNEPVGTKWIGIMPVAAGGVEKVATHLAQATLKPAAIP